MLDKKRIICIVGESGSGKTTLSRYLQEYGYGLVCSYTTRPMREGEVDGVDHIFVTEDEMPPKEQMLAYTCFGGNHYWASVNQIVKHDTVYVIDEDGVRFLKENFGYVYDIMTVYVKRPDRSDIPETRKDRDACRTRFDESDYDVVIENTGSLEEFLGKAVFAITGKIGDIERARWQEHYDRRMLYEPKIRFSGKATDLPEGIYYAMSYDNVLEIEGGLCYEMPFYVKRGRDFACIHKHEVKDGHVTEIHEGKAIPAEISAKLIRSCPDYIDLTDAFKEQKKTD